MQNWKDLYKELASIIEAKVPGISWQDLWHNQVNFLEEEHPFPTPALFYSFRTMGTTDLGKKAQKLPVQVDIYLFFETFADTYNGSWNQNGALGFLDLLTQVHAALHGTTGENYSSMRRISFNPVDTGGAGNTYLQSFSCELIDESAVNQEEEVNNEELDIEAGQRPPDQDSEPFFFPIL
ncbi:hypothetical protein D3C72_344350 [compost metagenome]